MKADKLDKAFADLISKRNIHTKLGINSGLVRTYRYNLKNGITISVYVKQELLQKAGVLGEKEFSRADLVSLLNFWKRTSQSARDHGPEYVIEKWEGKK